MLVSLIRPEYMTRLTLSAGTLKCSYEHMNIECVVDVSDI